MIFNSNKFFQIACSPDFLSLRTTYWGFLLTFSGLIYAEIDMRGISDGCFLPTFAILAAFLGMMTTMSSALLGKIEPNSSGIPMVGKFFVFIGLFADFVYLAAIAGFFSLTLFGPRAPLQM